MATLSLRYAGAAYLDRTRALERGDVRPDGIELEYVHFADVADLFRVMATDPEFDASEMSLSTYLVMLTRGDRRLVGLPVFPSRAFRHSQVYVNAAAGIGEPADLAGRNVGVPEYQITAAVWIRAFLQHDYGVGPDRMRWWTGGLSAPGGEERLPHDAPPGVTIERIGGDRTLESMLAAGELDALVTVRPPEPFLDGSGRVVRLFPDYRSVEEAYFRRTAIFPIMHLVVLRRDVYEAHPWAARALVDAFEESKRRGRARLGEFGTLAVMHPWLPAELEAVAALFGGDPFAYGVEPNLAVLEAFLRFSVEQNLAAHAVSPSDLFAPETLGWQPSG
jgi:4,5-dihydroxyphthalate decarboxylase